MISYNIQPGIVAIVSSGIIEPINIIRKCIEEESQLVKALLIKLVVIPLHHTIERYKYES